AVLLGHGLSRRVTRRSSHPHLPCWPNRRRGDPLRPRTPRRAGEAEPGRLWRRGGIGYDLQVVPQGPGKVPRGCALADTVPFRQGRLVWVASITRSTSSSRCTFDATSGAYTA